ncbi:hypothetical protein BC832DRAFT_549415 [Gaertneriomyces semiglobifer]|nr:hypothetical protein BC832DRAFT_549415 [Gaertneriomyces semiglobifer]
MMLATRPQPAYADMHLVEGLYAKAAEGSVQDIEVIHVNVMPDSYKDHVPRKFSGEITVQDLPFLEQRGEYELLITSLRNLVQADRRIFTHPFVKHWCARRWRNFFIAEAAKDETAVRVATFGNWLHNAVGLGDTRSPQQKVAERFLKCSHGIGTGPDEWIYAVGDGTEWSEEAQRLRHGARALPEPQLPEEFAKKTGLTFCPGLLNGLIPIRAFGESLPYIEDKYGVEVTRVDAHPLRSCRANFVDYLKTFKAGIGLDAIGDHRISPLFTSKNQICIGYSKGTPDLFEFLVEHPEYKSKINAIFSYGGAIYGSYIADPVHKMFQSLPVSGMPAILKLVDLLCPIIDLRKLRALSRVSDIKITDALQDLTTTSRVKFMNQHKEEFTTAKGWDIPVFCVSGSTVVDEVPYFHSTLTRLVSKYDNNNDMQLTTQQAVLDSDMSIHLGVVNANHWDMAFSEFPTVLKAGSFKFKHLFPKRASAVAMFLLSAELGLVD